MKRAKLIRRRKVYILNTLLLASVFLFYEMHAGIFMSEFAENRMEEFLPEGARAEIGKVEGGIFRNLTAEDVRVFTGEDSEGFIVERIDIDYRLWYPLLGALSLPLRPRPVGWTFLSRSLQRSFPARPTSGRCGSTARRGALRARRYRRSRRLHPDSTCPLWTPRRVC